MDSIYKKVKNDTANEFEKDALSQYYMITHLKETGYTKANDCMWIKIYTKNNNEIVLTREY